MGAAGLVHGTAGNMSAKDRVSGHVLIKPSGVSYDALRSADLVLVDRHGNVVEGRLRPSTELPMHLRIYAAMPEVMGVVHTHSPAATAFAVARRPLRTALAESAAIFGPEVSLAPYETTGTARLGLAAARAMKHGPAALLENHGVVAIGASVEDAFVHALLVEESARVQWMAEALGGAVPLPAAECRRIRAAYRERYGQATR